jgi:chromosome partitioning protein
MTISLVQQKGGVGKSTLALLLTLALRKAGHAVALQDYDAQGSASKLMALWPPQEVSTPRHYIFDSPPSLHAPGTIRAIEAADIILIPTSAAPIEYWEADATAAYVMNRNPRARTRIVLNKLKPRTTLARAFLENTVARTVPVLTCFLADRQGYQHATVSGLEVLDAAATDELLTFALNILAL